MNNDDYCGACRWWRATGDVSGTSRGQEPGGNCIGGPPHFVSNRGWQYPLCGAGSVACRLFERRPEEEKSNDA